MEKVGFAQYVPNAVVNAAKNGDHEAFEYLYSTYVNACYSLALRISSDPKLAEDIVQNSFVKVIHKIGGLENPTSFGSWLKRIVANETISCLRHFNLMNMTELTEGDEQSLQMEKGSGQIAYHSDNQGETEWELEKLVKKLPVEQKAVLMLHQVDGYKHQEIANMFGKSLSFSKVTLNRAFKKLREQINAESVDSVVGQSEEIREEKKS
ncbi:MAG: RNA polymerase sigma-70 factor (ECF subfamily) [Glaciecola sp.]|jgi:RNA polymerase sigma-70 factor (ECF subfamily)